MIAFTTGTLTAANAAAVGTAMAEKIRDDLVAHAAWELVEEYTPGGGAVTWYVLKCLATESGLVSDFYVVMGRTIATGELRFAIAEEYNSGTHTLSSFAPGGSVSTHAYDAQGRSPSTFVLGTTALTSSFGTPRYLDWAPSGTTTKWWLCVAEDGFTVALNGASNGFVHVGAYIPLASSVIALPLQLMGSGHQNGAMTRNPAVASSTAAAWALTIDAGGSTSLSSTSALLGFRGPVQYNDKLLANGRAVAEQAVTISVQLGNAAELWGYVVGKQKRMRVAGGTAPAGFTFGDAYSLDGRLWVPYSPTDLRMWDTGVAA